MARQGVRYPDARRTCRSPIPRPTRRCPRDGATLGEIMLRGNTVMKGYLQEPARHGRGVPRRLVPHRRPRGAASRRLRRGQGPLEGHHHLGRREHLVARGRGVPLPPPGGDGGGGGGAPGREVGRDAVRFRGRSKPGATRRARPRSSPGAASTWRASRCRSTVVFGDAAQDLDRQDPEVRAAGARARAVARGGGRAAGRWRSRSRTDYYGPLRIAAPDRDAGARRIETPFAPHHTYRRNHP